MSLFRFLLAFCLILSAFSVKAESYYGAPYVVYSEWYSDHYYQTVSEAVDALWESFILKYPSAADGGYKVTYYDPVTNNSIIAEMKPILIKVY